MVVTVEQFLARYSQFITVPAIEIESILLVSERFCPARVWGRPLQREGVMLYAAHTLSRNWDEMTKTIANASSVASGRGGTASTSTNGDSLDQSTYGQQFKQLRSTLPITGFVF